MNVSVLSPSGEPSGMNDESIASFCQYRWCLSPDLSCQCLGPSINSPPVPSPTARLAHTAKTTLQNVKPLKKGRSRVSEENSSREFVLLLTACVCVCGCVCVCVCVRRDTHSWWNQGLRGALPESISFLTDRGKTTPRQGSAEPPR